MFMMRIIVEYFLTVGLVHNWPLSTATAALDCYQHNSTLTVNGITQYTGTIATIIAALQWSTVNVIYDKETGQYADSVANRMHVLGMPTMMMEHDFNISSDNRTSEPKAWSSETSTMTQTGNFLISGTYQFVMNVFCELSYEPVINNACSQLHNKGKFPGRLSPMTTEFLTWVDATNVDHLSQALEHWEHVVVIRTSQADALPLISTLHRSRDTTQLSFVTSADTPAFCSLSRRQLLPNLSQGLGGRTLRVVVKEFSNTVMKVDKGGTQIFQGVLINILDELSQRLNFSYLLQEGPDDSWGQQLDNGQWIGLIGMLARRESDLLVGPMRHTLDREAVADPTASYGQAEAVLVFRLPEVATGDNNNFFLRPLRGEVYAVVGGSMVVVLVILVLSRWQQWSMEGWEGKTDHTPALWTIVTDVQTVMAALFARTHDINWPQSSAGWVVFTTWVYVCMVVMGFVYSSQLTATLAVHDVTAPFTSLQELVEQDVYTWGMMRGTALSSIMQVSNSTVYKQFYQKTVLFSGTDPDIFSPSTDVQFKKVVTSKYVYFTGIESTLFEWQAKACNIRGVYIPGLNTPLVFYLQKHSPYTHMISEVLTHMKEAGIVTHLTKQWAPEQKRCKPPEATSAINVDQVKTAFFAVGTGLSLALLTLLLETWMSWHRMRARSASVLSSCFN